VENETWRAFNSWSDAINDYNKRISSNSPRPSYRAAYRHLVAKKISVKSAKEYWLALGSGNYYTARKFTPGQFASLCSTVRSYIVQS
jgi:flagellum-specific peptidoglycan hydrolase FlgJ